MAFILGIIGLGGMIMAVGKSGYDSIDSGIKLKKTINQLNDINSSLTSNLSKINQDIATLTVTEKQAYLDTLNDYINLKQTLTDNNTDFANSIKKIQMIGIIFIVVIFFLLLLKQFDLFKPIFEALDYPFVWLWSKITNKPTPHLISKPVSN